MDNEKSENQSVTDLGAKTVFRNMRLAAELFRNLTDEFRDCTDEEIEECIVKDSEGCPLEFKDELYSLGTDLVRLDTLLEARVPNSDESVRIRFNVETQANLSVRYPLKHRAQMYAAMLLATQNKESKGLNKYLNLKRSYTVWICPRAPRSLDGKVVRYGMLPYGEIPEGEETESLMDIIFVYPGKPGETDPGTVTDMLSLIFADDTDIGTRQKLLAERYKIQLDLFSLMSVFEVTDYVAEAREEGYEDGKAAGYKDGVAEGKAEGLKEGKAEGLKQGKAEGLKEGKAEGLKEGKAEGLKEGKAEGLKEGKAEGLREGEIRKSAESIVGIMQKFGCSLEEAFEAVKVSDEDRDEVLKLVKKIQKS